MKKKFVKVLICGITLVFVLGSVLTIKNLKPQKTLTEQEKIQILNTIKTYDVEDKSKLTELEKLIDENISYYSEDERDIMISKYSSAIYVSLDSLNNVLYMIGYDIEDVINDYGVDPTNPSTYKKIPDNYATVRGFLEELHTKGFILSYSDLTKSYVIKVDNKELLDKYGKYVSKSLSKLLEFNSYEDENMPPINEDKKTIDLDEVAKRISMIEDGIKVDKTQGYDYIISWVSAETDYYDLLIGNGYDGYFVSNEYLKEDVFNKYKELQEKYKDKTLGKTLEKIIQFYTDNGKKSDANNLKKVIDIVDAELHQGEIKEKLEEYQEYLDSNLDTSTEDTESESTTETKTN